MGYDSTRCKADAGIDDGGLALEQHCTNVSRRPYSQQRALQCSECIHLKIISVLVWALSVSSLILVNIEDARLACLPLNISMRIRCTFITFLFKFLFGNVLSINPRVSGWVRLRVYMCVTHYQDKTRQSLFPQTKTLVQGESLVKCVNDVK